jgi:cell division inhibitor SepF
VIGEHFRAGIPVVVNLTDLDTPEAKRVVDFTCGLIFSLRGGIERVTTRMHLLAAAWLEIVDDPSSASQDPGFFNQG